MTELAGNLRVGDILEINNEKFRITHTEHVKPGKGGAFAQIVCQNLFKSQKKEIKFRVEEKVEIAQVYEKKGIFLYKERNQYIFLEDKSSEEYRCDNPSCPEFLTEGCEVILMIDINENLLSARPQKVITCQVEMTSGYIPGQSASSQEKPATLTNGIVIKVPQYVKDGDMIKVDTEELRFVSKD